MDALLLIGGLLIVCGWVFNAVFLTIGFLMFGGMNPERRRGRVDGDSLRKRG